MEDAILRVPHDLLMVGPQGSDSSPGLAGVRERPLAGCRPATSVPHGLGTTVDVLEARPAEARDRQHGVADGQRPQGVRCRCALQVLAAGALRQGVPSRRHPGG